MKEVKNKQVSPGAGRDGGERWGALLQIAWCKEGSSPAFFSVEP